ALLRSSRTISAVICYNDVIAMRASFGLIRAGRQSGEGGVETFFGHQVALGALGARAAKHLHLNPTLFAKTPAKDYYKKKKISNHTLKIKKKWVGE
ncbi:hypothetical protein ACVGWK_00185, partial [Enterobacter sichuanensis]